MDNPDMSLALYRYLCDVVGTEEVVQKRRLIYTTLDNSISDADLTYISSGSRAEGLDLDGSDIDLMVLWNEFPIYENGDEVKHIPGTLAFVMDTTDCKIGFTQLKQYNKHYVEPHFCKQRAGNWYLLSTGVKENIISHSPGFIIHGPCISNVKGSYDVASCVRCCTWISQAKPWISRSRKSQTGKHVIESILEFGVLFVPVGCKNSPNKDLEWRISFSYAEKLLIWSFNHVQFLCYALLKIILKEIIKQATGDMLCSYFIKTIMLWICDEIEASDWKPNNILLCFMKCLDRLFYCIRYKTCAHYFIPENDLFENRFDKQEYDILLSTINNLRRQGWTCLLYTETLRSFRTVLEHGLSSGRNTTSYLSILCWLNEFFVRFFVDFGTKAFYNPVYKSLRVKTNNFYVFALSVIHQSIAQNLSTGSIRRNGNKNSYKIQRRRLSHLLIGLNHDAVSGWLLLASHFYVNKQYSICKLIVSYCMSKVSNTTILLAKNPTVEELTNIRTLEKLGCSMECLFRHFIIVYSRFYPSSAIRPTELDILNDGKTLRISPVMYGIFLNFLCNYHLRDDREKALSLRGLEMVVRHRYFIPNRYHLEVSNTLLSLAYTMNGNLS